MIVPLVLVRLLVVGLLLFGPWTDSAAELDGWDADRFHEIANAPGTPYADREVEYPPGSVLLAEAVGGGGVVAAHRGVVVIAVLAELAMVAVIGMVWGRRPMQLTLLLGTFLLPTIYLRFDVVAAALAVGALAAHQRDRDTAFFAAVVTGFLVKTWPAVLTGAPLASGPVRRGVLAIAGVGLSVVVWVGLVGIDGPEQVATFRHATGWHIESLPGVLARFVDGSAVSIESGAYRFGSVPAVVKIVGLALAVVIWATAWVGVRRSRADEALATAVSVAGLLVTSTLLSPQFLVWLLPFAALSWNRVGPSLRACLGASVVVTGIGALVIHPEDAELALPQLVFLVRNLLLVGVVVLGLRQLLGPARDCSRLEAASMAAR